MSADLPAELARLTAAFRQGTRLALLFDFDGTLAPIVPWPDQARVPDATRQVLEALRGLPGVELGFLSGRSLEDLTRQVAMTGVYLAGCGGLELDRKGVPVRHPEDATGRALMVRMADALEKVCPEFAGAWVERKPLGVAFHHRLVPEERKEALWQAIDAALAPFGTGVRRYAAARCLELLPDWGWHKGTALREIVGWVGAPVLPLYAGDDANDGEALHAATDLGGVAIGVGPRAPAAARHRLTVPAVLAAVLEGWLGELRGGR